MKPQQSQPDTLTPEVQALATQACTSLEKAVQSLSGPTCTPDAVRAAVGSVMSASRKLKRACEQLNTDKLEG